MNQDVAAMITNQGQQAECRGRLLGPCFGMW